MPENEGVFDFSDEAQEFYDSLTSVDDITNIWEQLAYIADYGEADAEVILDDASGQFPAKLIYGPPFVIVFDNTVGGQVVVFTIRRPLLRRYG